MRNDFAVFILTHGRADNVVTVPAIKKAGYTGKIYFIIDDEDEQAATIDYLAMMADIDIPTEDKNEMGGVDDE